MLFAVACACPVLAAPPMTARGRDDRHRRFSRMTISPLVAAAVPAGIAALKLAQHTAEQRPFRNLLSNLAGTHGESNVALSDGESDLDDFLQLVNDRLASAGFDTSLSFELSSDEEGNLYIGGNHPQQEEIQHILSQDPQITAAFHRLAASHQLASAAQRHLTFAEQYVNDPNAVARSTLPNRTDFRIIINENEIEIA